MKISLLMLILGTIAGVSEILLNSDHLKYNISYLDSWFNDKI